MPEDQTFTNRMLAKLGTIETVVAVIVAIFFAGGVWVSLNSSIASAQDVAAQNSKKLEKVQAAVTSIKTDVAVIKSQQTEAAKLAEKQTFEQVEQRKDIKQILLLLGGRNNDQ